jgi:predicted dehydrogenase
MASYPPLRLGLVGLNFGRHVANELMAHPGPVVLAGVCDLVAEKAQAMATELGVPAYASLDALLAAPEIDVIGLYTGPNGRAELLRRIIRAGKDVMTTKPFEVDPVAALDVLREAQALGRVIHLNSPNPRPFGEMVVIQDWIGAGRIGRPTVAHSSVWAYYGATPADGTWYDDPIRCPVAPIFRLGIYPLNSLLTIFGAPRTVQVTHTRVETGRPTPDNASLTIGCADGGIINIMASFVVGGPDCYKNALTIGGTRGVIYYRTGPKEAEGTAATLTLVSADGVDTREVLTHAGAYDWDFFAERVRGRVAADQTTPEQIIAALRVVQAMSAAERTGQTVAVGA